MGNREDLVAGARRCLAEKGYAATTVRDIAGTAGVSMAAIGYHFGSREALLNLALFELVDEWGTRVAAAGDAADDYEDWWQRMIDSFVAEPTLFLASVEAALLDRQGSTVRTRLGDGIAQGRRGMAATVLGTDEAGVDDATARTLGAVQLALVTGVLLQWHSDPGGAPSGDDVAAGLRALADRIDASS